MTAPKPMPRWLADHLVNTGVMTVDGITRRARASSCRDCGAVILTGLDEDWGAIVAVADPVPLTPLGETVARLANPSRRTWTLRNGIRLELTRRYRPGIPPAGAGRYDVLPEHRCGDHSLEHFAAEWRTFRPAPTAHDEPPF